jgi:hypothetical protein
VFTLTCWTSLRIEGDKHIGGLYFMLTSLKSEGDKHIGGLYFMLTSLKSEGDKHNYWFVFHADLPQI